MEDFRIANGETEENAGVLTSWYSNGGRHGRELGEAGRRSPKSRTRMLVSFYDNRDWGKRMGEAFIRSKLVHH